MSLPVKLPDNLLALADDAIRAIKVARSLGEVRKYRDIFKARLHVAKCVGAAVEAKNACAKVVLLATRVEGEALAGMEKAKGTAGAGRPKIGGTSREPPKSDAPAAEAERTRQK